MKKCNQKIEYVNIQHCLIRTKTFKLLEAVILEIIWKRVGNLKDAFPESILYLEKVSGISRHTIKVYMKKFETLNIIYFKDGKYFFKCDYNVFKERLHDMERKNQSNVNSKKEYFQTYTCYHFEVAQQLEITEMQFFFLDIHIGVFRRLGYGTSPREYIMDILNIQKSYYFKLKNELFEKGYLEFYRYPDLIMVNDSVIRSIGKVRN
ncbi:hypothetical protein [Flavobacterium gyeonganense]|uniref:Uncharacterized protein n=1 Tax=Flavobacterium gyeonganense TaxID=1310418 RepID=A0ABV5H8C5_9FLAO|nr:hypothetical protein [Flavobacterium gyeonganense]